MSPNLRRGVVSLGLVALFLLSLAPIQNSDAGSTDTQPTRSHATPLGQASTLTIGSWPDGANERVELSVPDGHSIKSLELGLEATTLTNSLASSMDSAGDFDANSVYDGMDVNKSSLQILPQDWRYDFESGAWEPEWTLGGNTNWAIRADNRLQGAQLAKAGTIGNNQESSMTLDVSQLPAATGTFRYSVSSESGYDYLNFCIDNTFCTRYSGWSNQWSGTINNAQYNFNIPANAQTLTWKYTKDGSVNVGSDTAWVDDILITPVGGSGNGEGNWTSDSFGPSLLGRGENLEHGLLHMDAHVPSGSVFEWQILDAQTGVPVPGFERLTTTYADLGMIDEAMHPLLKLAVYMKEAPGGGTPEIRSISHNGLISKTFETDPSAEGWQIQSGSWSNGVITSTGTVLSNVYRVQSGFSALDVTSVHSASGQLEYTVDGGATWASIDAEERITMDQPAFMVQFRMQATSGSFSWDLFSVELVRSSVVEGLRFDVGLDGASEWSMARGDYGPLGLQNTVLSGEDWVVRSVAPSSAASFQLALPLRGVHDFTFAVASPTTELTNPFMAMAVNGQDILSRNLANIKDLNVVSLTSTELTTLNNALGQASSVHGLSALPMAEVEVRIGSSLSSGDLHFGGVFAPYDDEMSLTLNAAHPLVTGLNSVLSTTVPVNGQRIVTLPVRMDGTGSVLLTVVDIDTQASVKPVNIEVANVTDTLVPGNDWVETTATFDLAPLGVQDAQSHATQSSWSVELQVTGERQQSSLSCPISALPVTPTSLAQCTASGTAMLWFDEGQSGSVSATGSSQFLQAKHHFKFPDGWEDEESVILSVYLISTTGPMLPVSTVFGLGDDQGVENDLEVKSWAVLSDEGIRSSALHPYLRAGEVVNIEVVLGFEGTDEGTPRSGQALVRFLVDGNEYATSSSYEDGVALFPFNIPTGRPSIELGVEVVPLRGQDVVSTVSLSHTFLFDNVPPTLMESSVERFDSRDISPRTSLSFTVADRPHLPTHAFAFMWRSWLDDTNMDGAMDAEEVHQHPLSLPANLSTLFGEYAIRVDTSDASQGDFFIGWLEVADSAGHVMEGGGSFSEPMFHVQLNANGPPSLGATSLGWEDGASVPWIHPGEWNLIEVPVWEQNGIYDIAELHLALAANTPYPSIVAWNQSTNLCTSENVYVEIASCSLVPAEEDDLFSRNGKFIVNFSIEWGYDPDTSITRTPHISMIDQSGQSNQFTLEPLSWRFSGELAISPSSLRVTLGEEDPEAMGYWVQPRTTFDVHGALIWHRTGKVPSQDLDLELRVGENSMVFEAEEGMFSGTMMAPLVEGTYGLFGSLFDEPNGAVYRGDGSAFIWFIVDNQAPRVEAVDQPGFNNVLKEASWRDLQFELRLDENARLDESSLHLHWSLNEAGMGLNSYTYDNGSVKLDVLGERLNGESIPVGCELNLDELMLPAFRTKPVELRIWVTGTDEAGLTIDSVFNDVDAPLRVWTLEQRVPEYAISPIELKPNNDIHQGDLVEVAAMISNNGLADGEANLVLELVESTGARTRLDARVIEVQSGENSLYQYLWKPGRDGSQWLEISIINGPNAQSATILVDEPRSDGVLGTIGTVNPALLGVVVFLVIGLVALLVFGLRREAQPAAPLSRHPPAGKKEPVPHSQQPARGPYGGQEHVPSPGENPYQ